MSDTGLDCINKGEPMTMTPRSVKVYTEHEDMNGDIRRTMLGLIPLRDASPGHMAVIVNHLQQVWAEAVNEA